MSFVFQDKEYLRYDEVAMFFGRSTRSIQRWVQERRLIVVTTPGGQRLIARSSLLPAGASPNAD